MQEWNEQKLPKVLPGHSGGRLPGRSTTERGREEEEEQEENGEGRIRNEIAQKVVKASRGRQARTKMPSRPHKEQSDKVSSKIGTARKSKTKKREEEADWQKEDQMEVRWAEGEKLEEILERRRRKGSSLHADVVQKVLELVVHERPKVKQREAQKKRRKRKDGLLKRSKTSQTVFWRKTQKK